MSSMSNDRHHSLTDRKPAFINMIETRVHEGDGAGQQSVYTDWTDEASNVVY